MWSTENAFYSLLSPLARRFRDGLHRPTPAAKGLGEQLGGKAVETEGFLLSAPQGHCSGREAAEGRRVTCFVLHLSAAELEPGAVLHKSVSFPGGKTGWSRVWSRARNRPQRELVLGFLEV